MNDRARTWALGWLLVVVSQLGPWLAWVAAKPGLPASLIVLDVVSVVVALGLAIWFIGRVPIAGGVLFAVNAMACLLGTFASFYVSYGTTRDWSLHLSRLDALMVAVGNLSTAGTGGITPKSELARGLVTLQYGLDLIAGLVVVGLLVSRLASRRG